MSLISEETGVIEEQTEDRHEKIDTVDFKMVTFSLGGKDYGIDIMKIKEIAKFSSFTYVPNCPSFVRGVYNLRGDIISIIDLRTMFSLSVEESVKNVDNGLILRLEDNVLGVVVDVIDKVVGIDSRDIQPPHPIFGDINIKYISGVVENDKRLYIILDVEKIFGRGDQAQFEEPPKREHSVRDTLPAEPQATESATADSEAVETASSPLSEEAADQGFIKETLKTFKGFDVSPLNDAWVNQHFKVWKDARTKEGLSVQLQETADAELFLKSFYSPNTDMFWQSDLVQKFSAILENEEPASLKVWNIGCSKGYETYSLACCLRAKYPSCRIKIYGNDIDLLSISTAPNLIFDKSMVPDEFHSFLIEGSNGFTFNDVIKDSIMFEYHDVLHSNPLEDIDLIVVRDMLSFVDVAGQNKLISEFEEKLKSDSLIIVGNNESLESYGGWQKLDSGVSGYKKVSG